jgi:hypothetical protein
MSLLKGVRSEIDVKIEVPVGDDSGSVCFVATYRKMTQTQRQQWREKTAERLRTFPEKHDQAEHVREWLLGWRDLKGPTGEEVEFSPENLDVALDAVEYCEALYSGFLDMVNGTALTKN